MNDFYNLETTDKGLSVFLLHKMYKKYLQYHLFLYQKICFDNISEVMEGRES